MWALGGGRGVWREGMGARREGGWMVDGRGRIGRELGSEGMDRGDRRQTGNVKKRKEEK